VEDFHGTATILAFKDLWQAAKETIVEDAVILLRGQVSDRDRDGEDPPIFLDDVQSPSRRSRPPERSRSRSSSRSVPTWSRRCSHGRARFSLPTRVTTPVELTLGADNGAPAPRFRSRSLAVDPMNGTLPALRELFGAGRVRLVRRGALPVEPPPGFF
jgi:DNA polymerase-3 subunit alpha